MNAILEAEEIFEVEPQFSLTGQVHIVIRPDQDGVPAMFYMMFLDINQAEFDLYMQLRVEITRFYIGMAHPEEDENMIEGSESDSSIEELDNSGQR
jgi:hypothetical protein